MTPPDTDGPPEIDLSSKAICVGVALREQQGDLCFFVFFSLSVAAQKINCQLENKSSDES